MPTPLFGARFAENITLPAATPVDVDVTIQGARDWQYILRNTGPNPVTALSLTRFPLGTGEQGDNPTAVPTGIPLAAGAALPIAGTSEPLMTLRLTLTSLLGSTVRVAGGGW